ncbi:MULTISPECIES: hypothetical protein [Thalassolituus]|jgi:predicted transcriptional regulator|uniref:hypothetical protein n=1 Tax=Thalassolituus TaxID=187492 RepID=UPI0023F39E25|nr:hypothetical protein [Thalassolituus oleivorans]
MQLFDENTPLALISIHPRHVSKLLSGEKKLEFRRVWAKTPVEGLIIYSTSPIQKIVAIAKIKQVHYGSIKTLHKLCREKSGGLTKKELYDYFAGKELGFALEIGELITPTEPLTLSSLDEKIRAPQSYMYSTQSFSKKLLTHWY